MDVLVGATASCLFLNQNGVVGGGGSGIGACGGGGGGPPLKARSESFSSSSSSSIGAPDDSDEENASKEGSGDVTDSEEVQSKFRGGLTSLGSMGSLEDSLPIKRGLSNYFSGKSKSFASLSDVVTTATTVKELEKRDNPFNKRRRVLIASKWSRKSSSNSSFYNHPNPKSMPLLASLNEDEDEDEDEEPEETQEDPSSGQSSSDEKEPQKLMMVRTPKLLDRGMKSFKSRSCYCLSDLQHQHEQ